MESDFSKCRWRPANSPDCTRLGWIGAVEGEWEFAYCDAHVDAFKAQYTHARVRPMDAEVVADSELALWRRQFVDAR